jgi:ribonuclease J
MLLFYNLASTGSGIGISILPLVISITICDRNNYRSLAPRSNFKNRNVLLLMADSTNVENPGFSIPEKVVHKNIEEIIKNTKGRLIIATFASLLERMLKIIDYSEKYGKKVVVEGRSMKTNIEICRHLGLLKPKKDTIISVEEMDSYPPERIVVLATGAQGDEYAAMMRISNWSKVS